jgi:hypothetical protein
MSYEGFTETVCAFCKRNKIDGHADDCDYVRLTGGAV